MLKFVTSLNDRLFGEYGQRFIEGWREKATDDINLTVFREDPLRAHPKL
jgi:hypothetical protein